MQWKTDALSRRMGKTQSRIAAKSVQINRERKTMSAISMIENVNSNLVARDSKTGATSWKPMSKKSFALTAEGCNLKGRALKKAHWDYLQRSASEMNSALTAEIAAGRIMVTAVSTNKNRTAGAVKWETTNHFLRHEVGTVAKRLTETDALELLAKKYGVDIAAIVANLNK